MRSNAPISLDTIRQNVPSAFATRPREDTTSEQYTHINTANILEAMMSSGYGVSRAQQKRTHNKEAMPFARHLLAFRPLDSFTEQRVGDAIPEVVLINGHDGRCAYQLFAGIFRLVCENGMITGDSFAGFRIAHRGNVVQEVINASEQIWQMLPKLAEWQDRAAKTVLSSTSQLAFAEDAMKVRFGTQRPFLSSELLQARRKADEGDDLWRVFNRVQENVMNGGIAGKSATGRHVVSKPINRVTKDVMFNQKLWNAAEAYMEAA